MHADLGSVFPYHNEYDYLDSGDDPRSAKWIIMYIYCFLRYVQNPLLLKGRKFDVRSYFLIACTSPYMVFFRHGYVRLTCDLYDPNSPNLSSHLTNQVSRKNMLLFLGLQNYFASPEQDSVFFCHESCSGGSSTEWSLADFKPNSNSNQ